MDPRSRGQSLNRLPDYPITRLPDSRALAAIGRTARLELVFEARGGRTVLAHAYAEPPFRIGHAFDLGGAAYVILVCSGPGVFAGDRLRQSIHVGRGARAVLTSQSALQIHPAPPATPAPPALVHHDYLVEDDGELHCHWDPVIPFAGARLDQQFDLQIADSSRLCWSDALMAGRVSRGETWQFISLAHELRLQIRSRLAYLERYALTPDRPLSGLRPANDRAIERPSRCGRAIWQPLWSTTRARRPKSPMPCSGVCRSRLWAAPSTSSRHGCSSGVFWPKMVHPSAARARLTARLCSRPSLAARNSRAGSKMTAS
jgi:urease accessory protein UreH